MKGDRTLSEEEAIAAVRGYFEQELREAGARRVAPMRTARRPRSASRGIASLAMLAIVVVVAAMALRIGAFGVVVSPMASDTAAPSTPASPSASGPQTRDLPGLVSFFGSSAWMLLDSGLSVSDDAGRTWRTLDLPSGVASSAVGVVAMAPGRPVWLAVHSGDGYRLYRKANGAAAWSSVLLTPSWALLPSTSGTADMVKVTPGPGGLVTVAETMSGGSTSAVTSLFVSTDDGKSFTEHPPRSGSVANMYWDSVTLVTPQTGVVIAGPSTYPHVFLHTSDGGTTWSESRVSGLPAAPNYTPGTPMLIGSDIQVPVTICGADCNTSTFVLLVSHDGGATFSPQGVAVPAGGNSGSLGPITWVWTGGGILQETTDGGQTWTAITAVGLPINVSSLDLTSPSSATAVIVDSGCAGFKTDCLYRNYLVGTTDGGRTWVEYKP